MTNLRILPVLGTVQSRAKSGGGSVRGVGETNTYRTGFFGVVEGFFRVGVEGFFGGDVRTCPRSRTAQRRLSRGASGEGF